MASRNSIDSRTALTFWGQISKLVRIVSYLVVSIYNDVSVALGVHVLVCVHA